MALKILFKRKVGGTVVGNLLRSTAAAATGGLLGSGIMMKKESMPTAEDIANALGASAETFHQKTSDYHQPTGNQSSIIDAFKSGLVGQRIKSYWFIPAGILAALAAYFSLKKKNSSYRRRR